MRIFPGDDSPDPFSHSRFDTGCILMSVYGDVGEIWQFCYAKVDIVLQLPSWKCHHCWRQLLQSRGSVVTAKPSASAVRGTCFLSDMECDRNICTPVLGFKSARTCSKKFFLRRSSAQLHREGAKLDLKVVFQIFIQTRPLHSTICAREVREVPIGI